MDEQLQAILELEKNGYRATAIRRLKDHLRSYPQHIEAWYTLARIETSPPAQWAAVQTALGLQPDHPEALNLQAALLEEYPRLGGDSRRRFCLALMLVLILSMAGGAFVGYTQLSPEPEVVVIVPSQTPPPPSDLPPTDTPSATPLPLAAVPTFTPAPLIVISPTPLPITATPRPTLPLEALPPDEGALLVGLLPIPGSDLAPTLAEQLGAAFPNGDVRVEALPNPDPAAALIIAGQLNGGGVDLSLSLNDSSPRWRHQNSTLHLARWEGGDLSLSIPDIKAAAALDPLIGLIAYLSYSPQVSVEKLGPLFDEPAAFLDPQARPLAFILAYSYLSLGQSGPALEIIDFLNDPAQPDPRLTANRAWAIAQEGNLATAISLYTPLLDSPALPAADLHSTMGDLYAEAGQLEAAQTAYEAALLSDPQSPRPYLSLGRLALAQNQYNQALEFFSTALSLQPGYAIAYYERARLNVALGRLAEAASDAEQASTLEAYSGDYLALKAEVLALGGDSLGAIQLYERALRFDPQNAPAHLALARLYQSLGNVEGAARAAESALALSPNDPAAWLQRGQIHLAEGDFPTALNDFSQGLSYDPADSELKANLYVGRCAVYARLGDDGAAASDCDQALALSPRNGYALEQRGLIRHRAEDRAGAQSDFTEAITYEPAAYEAHYYLGLYALQEGRYDNAGQFLSRSLEIAPDYGLAYAARGVVYRLAGDWPAAIADLEQALALLPAEVYSFYELGLAKRGLADQLAEQGQAGPAYQRYQESERALLNFLNASDPAAEFVNEALAVLNYVRNALVALQNQTN